MTTLLALETSGALCSVCVQHAGSRFENTRIVERMHNECLLPMVAETCLEAGVAQRAFEAVAFGCGPGSFTGVRIAAACAQAIAYAANARILPVASSRALAQAALLEQPAALDGVITLIRSRRDLYYLASYTVADGGLKEHTGDMLIDAMPRLPELVQDGWKIVGAEPPWWNHHSPVSTTVRAASSHVADLALLDLARGGGLDAAAGLPSYVGGDSPWSP